MRYGRYGTSYLLMRLGLGCTFLWIGIDIFRHPDAWIGYLPTTIPGGLDRALALQLNGALDVALGVLFLIGRFPYLSALLAVGHLAGILIFYGIDQVTIRDTGLLGVSLALLFWPRHRRHKLFSLPNFRFWERREQNYEE